MAKQFLAVAILAMSLTGCQGTGHPKSQRYSCQNGQAITATYVSSDTAIIKFNQHKHVLKIAISADGARYIDDQYVWWTKGRNATLFYSNGMQTGDQITHCRLIAAD